MLKLIKRMLPVLVCAVIFVMSGALGAECSAEEDYGYFGALEDHQDALSGEQAQELLDLLDSTAREIHANVGVILGNASLDGLSERSYAKEFHNRSFGEYSDSIVLMLVQAGSGKVDQIYCTDRAYDMYQPRIDSIFDAVYDGLDSSGGDNYYAAVTNYCAYLRSHDSVPSKAEAATAEAEVTAAAEAAEGADKTKHPCMPVSRRGTVISFFWRSQEGSVSA